MNSVLQSMERRQGVRRSKGYYRLIWRSKTLIVSRSRGRSEGIYVRDIDWAIACLSRSPVRRVKLASDLQAAELLFWAEASMAAGCEVYLRLPGHAYLPHKQKPLHWLFKCVMDRLVVFVVLLLLSPVLLGISLWIRIVFQESILVHQWHVGLRGRLYRACYFRTQSETDEGVAFTRWMRRYRLDRLPKFLNVLRGEMSIVGAFPQRLIDIPKVDPALHRQLNALPGITGAWQLESRLSRLDWRCLHNLNLEYLLRWSLRRDFSYLVLTAPKILIEENL